MNKYLILLWLYIKDFLNIRSVRQLEALLRRKMMKLFYRRKYNTSDILNKLVKLGICKGDTLVVHSSWDEFYNYTQKPTDLINGLLDLLGENGNLIMPSFPLKNIYEEKHFDIKKDPTGAGILAECFRRFPKVLRTMELHPVCIYGPLSEKFATDFDKIHSAWDQESTYFKLINLDCKIICLGLEKHYLPTQYHCVEDCLKTSSLYYSRFFTKKIWVDFRSGGDFIFRNYYYVSDDSFVRRSTRFSILRILTKYFSDPGYKKEKISNLYISFFLSKYMFDTLINLHKQGETVYTEPKLYLNEV